MGWTCAYIRATSVGRSSIGNEPFNEGDFLEEDIVMVYEILRRVCVLILELRLNSEAKIRKP